LSSSAALAGESHKALFREQAIEFELAQLKVEPRGVQKVIEPDPGVLEVEAIAFSHGRKHRERNVFVKCAGSPDI